MSTATDLVSPTIAVLQTHPLYSDEWRVRQHPLKGDDCWWIGLQSPDAVFSLNVNGPTCYVLSISIRQSLRGKGHGLAIYRAIEQIAKRLGCNTVQMTASGWTYTSETRLDYLLRHGYERVNKIEVRKSL